MASKLNQWVKSLLAAALCTSGAWASAATVTINAYDFGWYRQDGLHTPGNINTISGKCCGGNTYRDWFAFNLSGVTGTVVSADLKLTVLSMGSNSSTETWQLHDFSGNVDTLVAGTGGVAYYNDLGTGVLYDQATLVKGVDTGLAHVFSLNAAALADLNGALGSKFALGGWMPTFGGADEDWVRWDGGVHSLTLEIADPGQVPEPATLALSGLALLGVAGLRRKKGQREHG